MSQTIIHQLYEAFSHRDAEGMAACYHPDARFKDGAFDLHSGAAIGDMWRMLCANGKDLRIEFRDVHADDTTGSAHWEALYTFSRTGRAVHNVIEARFKFRDGKIIEHSDTFDFWRWSRQALGLPGWLMGWTPFLKNKVHQMAISSLEKFRKQK